ncbi:hypothetical protein [Microbispora sp. CSR-4]|nr:hypothetical protein [Microbispora sp. CSR-4]
MILISAALVLAAIVLLIAGVVLGTPPLVMWSIVVSVLSAVCLLIGALLRRHELFPAGGRAAEGTAPTPQGSSVPQLAHVGAVSGAYGGALAGAPAHPVAAPMLAAPPVTHHGALPPQTFPSPPPQRTGPITRPPAGSGRGLAPDAIVIVIPGRKRFHLATCRQLAGRETEELTHEEAREEGFTPCTTCLPEVSTRTAEPEEAPSRGGTARGDAARDESLRAEAAPTTTTPSAGTSGTTGRTPSRPTSADREPPVARFPQPGVPGPRLPESPGPESSGPGTSVAGAAGAAAVPPASGSSAAAPSTEGSSAPSDDEAREEPRETAGKPSGKTAGGETAEQADTAADTTSEAGAATTGGTHTPVDWFGRRAAQEPGAETTPQRPAASAPQSPSSQSSPSASPSASSSGSSSGSSASSRPSATSWSAPAWSPPATGSASGRSDAETDESLTDTAVHGWFKPGMFSQPWDPARSKAAGEATEDTSSPEGGESGAPAAKGKAKGAASPRQAASSRADDEQARDDQNDSGTADADTASRPEDAPTPAGAGARKPVEPAETPGSGRAGSAASAGSTSGSAPAAGSTAEKSSGKADASNEEDGAGDGDRAAATARPGRAATSRPGGTDTDLEDRGGSGDETGEDRAADAAEPSADGDVPVRVMIGTRRYHKGECPLISGMGDSGVETMTRAEADEAGLTPCSVCQND